MEKRTMPALLFKNTKLQISAYLKIAAFFAFLLFGFVSSAFAGNINNLRIGQGTENIRIVFDADSKFDYQAFLLAAPNRLVIDAYNVKVAPAVGSYRDKNNVVSQIRLGNINNNSVRIAFDLQKPVIIKKAFMLPPQSKFGWRFVIDVSVSSELEFKKHIGSKYAYSSDQGSNVKTSSSKTTSAAVNNNNVKKVIVLDPGHGGKDPGAIGCSGVYEKNITLAMAKELKSILDSEGRYQVYLTRSTDIFIPLRDRVKIARKHNADLFLSIHADSALNKNAKGLSVYTLSENASDKEAEALAERENKADVIAGLDLLEHSKEVSDILINLAQRETMNRSSEFAGFMVQEMKNSAQILDNTHRFAGFAVLKAPDVPSVLLEMGYLSNRTEERLLKQSSYRKKLASSTSKAIKKYFDNMRRASVF